MRERWVARGAAGRDATGGGRMVQAVGMTVRMMVKMMVGLMVVMIRPDRSGRWPRDGDLKVDQPARCRQDSSRTLPQAGIVFHLPGEQRSWVAAPARI